MIKLIVSDLDGTLFYPKRHFHGMTNRNRDFLRNYLNHGGDLLLASGRSTAVIPGIEKALQHKVGLLGCNGSFMYENSTLRYALPLNREKILELISNSFNEFGIVSWFLFDETKHIYVSPTKNTSWILKVGTPWVSRFSGFYSLNMIIGEESFWKRINEHDCYKLMPVFGLGQKKAKQATEAYLALQARYGDFFNIVVSANADEITHKDANKGSGIEIYCREHGISKEEVIVIGDSGNDLEMFSRFPHSFAMARAPKHIRDMANHTVAGVYQLQEYLDHPERMEKDAIKKGDVEKALSQIIE